MSLCGRLIIFFSIESCYVMVYKAKIDIQFAEKYWLYKTWPKEILSLGNATTALITQLIDHFSLWKLKIKVIETESLNILELMQFWECEEFLCMHCLNETLYFLSSTLGWRMWRTTRDLVCSSGIHDNNILPVKNIFESGKFIIVSYEGG